VNRAPGLHLCQSRLHVLGRAEGQREQGLCHVSVGGPVAHVARAGFGLGLHNCGDDYIKVCILTAASQGRDLPMFKNYS
jgi:hypothetical protein